MSKLRRRPVERAPMDAADAAGREHPDPRRVAAIIVAATVVAPQPPDAIAAPRLRPRDLAHGALAGPSRAPRARRRQPDQQPARVERDGRRDRAGRPDRRLGRRSRPRRSAGTARPWLMSVDSRATTGAVARARRRPRGRWRGGRRRSWAEGTGRSVGTARRVSPAGARRGRRQVAQGGPVAEHGAALEGGRGATPPPRASSQPARNPASNASPAPVVSAATDGRRRDLEPETVAAVAERGSSRPCGRASRPRSGRARADPRRRACDRPAPAPRPRSRTRGPGRRASSSASAACDRARAAARRTRGRRSERAGVAGELRRRQPRVAQRLVEQRVGREVERRRRRRTRSGGGPPAGA